MDKIVGINELASLAETLRVEGKRVVQCHGVFDLLHPGHFKHLEEAKKQGDVLVVTITSDRYVDKRTGKPAFNQNLRADSLASLECVDYVAINDSPLAVEAIKKLKPDIYCKGKDYATLVGVGIRAEEEAVKSVGGTLHFTDTLLSSSTALINRYFDVLPDDAKAFLRGFKEKYSANEIIESLNLLKRLKVMVIGDTIIDQYIYCNSIGKSPKDNIMVVKKLAQEKFAGGVLASANHIAGFCGQVDLVTCLGRIKSYERFIRSHLKKNINPRFYYRDDTSTIVKQRYVDSGKLSKIFGVSVLDDFPLSEDVTDKICSEITNGYDMILVTDFGHGFLNKKIADTLYKNSKFIAVNTQTNTDNAGFNLIGKYNGANYICLDEPETRLACHDKYGDLKTLIKQIASEHKCDKIAITHGQYPTLIYDGDIHTIPVFSKEAKDTTGAGDAFLSITAPCVASGMHMDMVGFIGNAVGALKVNIVCNRSSVEPEALFKFIKELLK